MKLETYHLIIKEHDFSYGFSTSHSDQDPIKKRLVHSDNIHISLKCELLNPSGFGGEIIEVSLYSDRKISEQLRQPPWDRKEARIVGFIDFFRNSRSITSFMPDDRLMNLYLIIQSGALKDIVALGEPLKRKKAILTSINFETNFIPEDWY